MKRQHFFQLGILSEFSLNILLLCWTFWRVWKKKTKKKTILLHESKKQIKWECFTHCLTEHNKTAAAGFCFVIFCHCNSLNLRPQKKWFPDWSFKYHNTDCVSSRFQALHVRGDPQRPGDLPGFCRGDGPAWGQWPGPGGDPPHRPPPLYPGPRRRCVTVCVGVRVFVCVCSVLKRSSDVGWLICSWTVWSNQSELK